MHNVPVAITLLWLLLFCIEQQQLAADIKRLTSDKADLLTKLQCYEDELKTANECENCII